MSRRERQRRRQRNKGGPHRIIFLALGLVFTCVAIAGIVAVAWVINVANGAPSLDTKKPINLGAPSRVYAADGTRLGFINATTLRTPIGASEIPDVVREATVAIEDRRFYEHKGVDFEGIVRAALKNLESKKDIQGGSTLTMQLVRNLYTGERARSGVAGYKRKIREAKLAQELEDRHPGRGGKQWILDKYVNSVPYGTVGGQTAIGIQAAARIFFDKPAARLTLREAALLAGLPQAPSDYNPFLDKGAATARRNDVLQRMADQGYISQATADRTKLMSLGVKPNRTYYVSRPLGPGWLPTAPDYEVHTFGRTYGGSMNLVTATLKSDNTVYAQLDADLGPETVAQTARDMGITSPLHGYPAEGLGGLTNGVSPLEMARAYATIANGGYRVKPIVVRKVTFPDGHVDLLGKPVRHKVFDDGVTYEATQILEKNVQAGTGVKAQIGCPAAGKTGTVDNFTDAWFVGFTPRLVTSVWVGHPKDPYPLGPNAQGGAIAAPIWGLYMKSAKGKFCGDFPKPKVPFSPQPFFGKYSHMAVPKTDNSGGPATNSKPGGKQK